MSGIGQSITTYGLSPFFVPEQTYLEELVIRTGVVPQRVIEYANQRKIYREKFYCGELGVTFEASMEAIKFFSVSRNIKNEVQ